MNRQDRIAALEREMAKRILILDGSMGAYLQGFGLTNNDFHGERFVEHPRALKGNNDLLVITRPDVVARVHEGYLAAGVDIIETNTFSATTIGLHDFLFPETPASGRKDRQFFQRVVDDVELDELVQEMNMAAARIARQAADRIGEQTGQRRFVAGSLGPLSVTASISPDVNDPGFRAVTFDQIRKAYAQQVRALLDGGVDLLLVETIFDTLNGKAALVAIAPRTANLFGEAFTTPGKRPSGRATKKR